LYNAGFINLIVNNKGNSNNFTLISNNKGASNTTSIITNNPSYNITYLVVGGGGGGGSAGFSFGTGGGAGGVLYGSTYIFKKDILTITVGAGGAATSNGQSSSIKIGSSYIPL